METELAQDISDYYPDCLKAERKGCNTLILTRVSELHKRFDGQWARYRLAYYWHLTPDSPQSSVQGDDYTYWKKSEFDLNKGLFEQFSCTG